MTGYSSVRREEDDFSLSLSLKATNHRFLDLQIRLPPLLEPLEPFLRGLVKDRVGRGHVELAVSLEGAGLSQLQLDRKLVEAYASACRQLSTEYGFASEPDPVALLRVPGVVAAANLQSSPAELERFRAILQAVTGEALARLNEMRTREGEILERSLRAQLEKLERLAEDIGKLADRMPSLFQRRLEKRLRDISATVELDASRLAQEVVFLASRSDIAEEVTRLRSHVEQAKRVLDESSQAGKSLDFLLQEMNREANTVLAKTTEVPEVGLEIARHAIEMKTEIERLREQAQNIE